MQVVSRRILQLHNVQLRFFDSTADSDDERENERLKRKAEKDAVRKVCKNRLGNELYVIVVITSVVSASGKQLFSVLNNFSTYTICIYI